MDKMNEMQAMKIFENEDFGQIRTMEIDGKPYFSATDVAKALGYAKPRNAIKRHCRGALKRGGVSKTTNQYGVTTSQTVEMSFIPEGDIYRLIVHSKLPSAEKFERWVFDEVLPKIRQDGQYINTNKSKVLQMRESLLYAKEMLDEKDKQIEELTPKALFADAVTASEDSIPVGDFAKVLKQNGIDIGRTRLFEWLRTSGYLIKVGISQNIPTQYSMNLDLMEIEEKIVYKEDGTSFLSKTARITAKGQKYFVDKLLNNKMIVS